MNDVRRISIFTGHFGSGKTEVAVNYAIQLAKMGKNVAIVDFDVVNPYYRTKDVQQILEKKDIKVIAGQYANSNVELSSLPAEIESVFDNKSLYVVFDVGGDDDGATALGRYFDRFNKEEYNMFCVLNERRMQTSDKTGCIDMIENIERASRLKINKLINNTHLGRFTTFKDVLIGQTLSEKVSNSTQIEVAYISGTKAVLDELPKEYEPLVFPIDLYLEIKE